MFVQNKYIVFLNRNNEDFANRGMYLVQKKVVPNGVGVLQYILLLDVLQNRKNTCMRVSTLYSMVKCSKIITCKKSYCQDI